MAISTQLQQLLRVLLPDKGFKTAGSHRDAIIAGVEESKTYTDEKSAEAVKKTGNETIAGVKTFSDGIVGNVTGNVAGNASTVTNGVYSVGDQTIGGVKTFESSPVVPDATEAQHPVTKGVFDKVDALLTDVKNLDKISTTAGFITNSGTISTAFSNYYHARYNLVNNQFTHYFSTGLKGSGISLIHYYDVNDNYLGYQYPITQDTVAVNYEMILPENASYVKINYSLVLASNLACFSKETIDVKGKLNEMSDSLDVVFENITQKTIEFTKKENEFWVRTRFDETRDLFTLYYVNSSNKNVSPEKTVLGLNTLTSQQLRDSAYTHYTYDSTPPFYMKNYWYLSGQHGYLIPRVVSTGHDKTQSDIGSTWQDSNSKVFTLIKIDGSYLYFAPRITVDGDGLNKNTSDYSYGYVMTTLTHLSGAIHTSNIAITSSGSYQWKPIDVDISKMFLVDGKEITENKTYNCNEVVVVDIHDLYDPQTITQWEPSLIAEKMARSIFTHKFVGATCTITNSIEVYRPIWFTYYGAFQPMGLRKYGDYDPYIFIPKVKSITNGTTGVTTDWKYPQNCGVPNQTWAKTIFLKNSADLIDVNDIPDRIVQFQKKTNTDEYLLGFAAGYSLISSATKNSIRKNNLGQAFQFKQDDRNKFYSRVIDELGVNGDILNSGFVSNYTMYYSYFDPAANDAIVYYYKDGDHAIVYIHAHSAIANTSINLPTWLEGKVVEIIEKTNGATLVTDTVIASKIVVSFDNAANYLVIKL